MFTVGLLAAVSDEITACSAHTGHERRAVAALHHLDDARAMPQRDLRRTVDAAVVGDQHLTANIALAQRVQRAIDAGGDRSCLVEAWHYNGKLW